MSDILDRIRVVQGDITVEEVEILLVFVRSIGCF